ncbi:MAG: integrase core domain-containing protein [Phycisphaeraceae bacterium]|nr:integrase core domain-containing protein [Phycisphaeraceae bacterium]
MQTAFPLYRRLMAVLAGSRRSDLRQQVEFLKAENEILRRRLPTRIRTTVRERRRLIKLGRAVGPALASIITIVSPATFRRWVLSRRSHSSRPHELGEFARKPGRPRTPQAIRALILRMARETEWGQTRITGELRKLGFSQVSRSTVRSILREAGVPPRRLGAGGTWSKFLRQHARTLWACDFVATRIVTWRGVKDAFLLVFLHIGTRRMLLSPSTTAPTEEWVARETETFLQVIQSMDEPANILIRDRDTKFGPMFDAVLEDHRARAKVLPPRSPNLNAHVERAIQTLRRECLDHFIILGCRHMNALTQEYALHYNRERPHASLDHRTPSGPTPERLARNDEPRVVCHTRLGGVVQHYCRKAA